MDVLRSLVIESYIQWCESLSLYRALFLLFILLFHLDLPQLLATKFVAVAFVVVEVRVVGEVLAVEALVVSVACCSTLD